MNELKEFKKIIEDKGLPIRIDTPFCKIYKETHLNCIGCESEEGCKRYVGVLGVICESLFYKPSSFDDFLAQMKKTQERIMLAINGKKVF